MKGTRIPVWLIILADVLLLAIGLCTFAYFHHIRILWAPFEMIEPTPHASFEKPEDVGDFSETVGAFLSSTGAVTKLSDDVQIRHFLENNGFPMTTYERSKYIGLYQSKNIFVTVEKIADTGYQISAGETAMEIIYIYDIYIRNVENLYTSAYKTRTSITNLINNVGYLKNASDESFTAGIPIAAMNGDYWGNAYHTLTALRNGKLYLEADEIESDILVMYYDGTMEVYTQQNYDKDAIQAKNPYQIWNFGPGLLDDDGFALTEFNIDHYDTNVITTAHPRAGIGYYEPGHYCFVTVAGRQDRAQGLRMVNFAQLFENLGCTVAYNMDGGGSSQSYYNGKVLYPGDGRDLFDIICIGEIKDKNSRIQQAAGGDSK
ncbi:MAG: hypothetical protein E7599_02615 [Ruminococcaceae bacterium]|nr:hypothetical protein [Oscillospiraceae bacterium]